MRTAIVFVCWLCCIAQAGLLSGESRREIADLIRASARRHGVEEMRALNLGWAESRHTDAVRFERNGLRSCGPLQVHEKFTPGICEATLAAKVDAGMKWFAHLILKHGDAAERVYILGH